MHAATATLTDAEKNSTETSSPAGEQTTTEWPFLNGDTTTESPLVAQLMAFEQINGVNYDYAYEDDVESGDYYVDDDRYFNGTANSTESNGNRTDELKRGNSSELLTFGFVLQAVRNKIKLYDEPDVLVDFLESLGVKYAVKPQLIPGSFSRISIEFEAPVSIAALATLHEKLHKHWFITRILLEPR